MINYHKFTLNMGKWKITAEVTSVNFGFSQLCYQHKQLRTKPKKISLDIGFEAGTLLYQCNAVSFELPSHMDRSIWLYCLHNSRALHLYHKVSGSNLTSSLIFWNLCNLKPRALSLCLWLVAARDPGKMKLSLTAIKSGSQFWLLGEEIPSSQGLSRWQWLTKSLRTLGSRLVSFLIAQSQLPRVIRLFVSGCCLERLLDDGVSYPSIWYSKLSTTLNGC